MPQGVRGRYCIEELLTVAIPRGFLDTLGSIIHKFTGERQGDLGLHCDGTVRLGSNGDGPAGRVDGKMQDRL